jgi:adenylosuccinate lyase
MFLASVEDRVFEAVSPVDGRYRPVVRELSRFFSELGLARYRLLVEATYLKKLLGRTRPHLAPEASRALDEIVSSFNEESMVTVKELERETGHDIEALVRFLRSALERRGLVDAAPLVHIGLTSEDVNNLAYSLALRDCLSGVLLPSLSRLTLRIAELAYAERETIMLARTHGQPAVPTTLGKELAVHAHRLSRSLERLGSQRLPGKASGAVGTYAGLVEVFGPGALEASEELVSELGLSFWPATKQVLPHDDVSRLLQELSLLSMILVDLCRDFWLLSMLGYVYPRPRGVGSSTMPQKSNPVELENAEGNLELAANTLSFMALRLAVSRLQRDLSDSTIRRNYGVALAHLLLGVRNIDAFLDRMAIDREAMRRDLEKHPEALSEAVQIRARLRGVDILEELRSISPHDPSYQDRVRALLESRGLHAAEIVPRAPEEYIGLAPRIAELVYRLVRESAAKRFNVVGRV